ncbi:FERM domain-containing protein 7 [Cichlidogyrus casuarinus]|uniref:FERM domain-containing protein 7 n=1 Tax=Cichlidogyrus casuarinus TaxID=1844966 RepID=A0ABD2Q661_9PLAT
MRPSLPRTPGQHLYSMVMSKLEILEYDYFDLEYMTKEGFLTWLDHEKAVGKQQSQSKEYLFNFAVKFYTPHPNLLEDEYTRYLFALQIKKDLCSGALNCNENTAALLAAFIVQAEIGDFLEDLYLDPGYLLSLKLFKNVSNQFLLKVMECHRTLIGQTPNESDYNLLDTVRKVELYGLKLHVAKDPENVQVGISVCHQGVVVVKGTSKTQTYSWARIRKLSFKRKKFLLKLHPNCLDSVDYSFETRDECKSFWKQCIEHHAFFRSQSVLGSKKKKSQGVTKGSSFVYTGRTQKELIEYVRENYGKLSNFERSASTGRVAKCRAPTYSGALLPTVQKIATNNSNGALTDSGAFYHARSAASGLAAGYSSTPLAGVDILGWFSQ